MDNEELQSYIAKAYKRALDEMAEQVLQEAYRPLHQRPLYASIFADVEVETVSSFQGQVIDTTAIVLSLVPVENSTTLCCMKVDSDESL